MSRNQQEMVAFKGSGSTLAPWQVAILFAQFNLGGDLHEITGI